MAEQYRFFGSAVGDTREYSQVEFAEVFGTIIGNGYLGQVGNELVTTENTPVGMSVLVGTGKAWINGYWYSNESVKEIPISTADATNPRIDRVVLRLDVLNARSIVAVVKTGTPSSTPVAPSLTQTEQLWEIPLYQVYVAPAVLAIYDEDLTDERYQALLQDTDEILEIVDTKAPINSPTFTGTVSGITKTMVGLGNVDNTSDANKPISTATQTALDGKLSLTGGTLTGNLVMANGKGIDFSASQSGGATSSLLDDYEEGTFTPVFTSLTVGNGLVFGYYTKIGDICHIILGFKLGSTSSITGNLTNISGLPFASKNVSSEVAFEVFGTALDTGVNHYDARTRIRTNLNTMGPILRVGTTTVLSATFPFAWTENDNLVFNFSYKVN